MKPSTFLSLAVGLLLATLLMLAWNWLTPPVRVTPLPLPMTEICGSTG